MKENKVLIALILGTSIVLAGISLALGIMHRKADRFVRVKGLAERSVKANQGSWKITFRSRGNTLDEAIVQNVSDRAKVHKFLKDSGFEGSEVKLGTPRVFTEGGYQNEKMHFIVEDNILILSEKVDRVHQVASQSSDLLKKGVALSGWQTPSYFFTALASIKPEMIERATKDARRAAEKFAQDSESNVGKIRHATQGYFSFKGESSGMEEREQIEKIARVVITVDYLLD